MNRKPHTHRTIWRLLKLLAPFWRWIALSVLLGVLTIGSGVALMTTSAYIIAKAALRPSIAELQVAIVGVRFFGITRGAFRYLERLVSHQVTFRLLARLRVWFYRALEPLAPARLMGHRSGDLLARIVADVETLQNFYLRAIAPPLVAVFIALLAGGLLAIFDRRLAAALLVFLVLAGLGVPLLARFLGRDGGRRLVAVRSALNATLVDSVQGMADLQAFGQEGRYQAQIARLGRAYTDLQTHAAGIAGLQSALSGLSMNLATLAVLSLAIPLVRDGRLDGVYLALLVLAVIASFEAVIPLPMAFQHLERDVAAAERLFEIVDAEPAVRDGAERYLPSGDHALVVQNLRFRYDEDGPWALDGVSLALPPGGRLAVVGPSGAGKSTLINLLLRFWDYQGGYISLGGRELHQLPQDEVRRAFSVVSQQAHLFSGTVRENLLLARPDAEEADIVRAARQAQIHEFVRSLPDGYDTWVGEGGLRLSGGERQRLTIARALLKDAPILVLDEPAANLDPLTGRAIMDTVNALGGERAILIITHHPVGLEEVDEILVLRDGRVVERGRHHDLVQVGGFYRRMWAMQRRAEAVDGVFAAPGDPPIPAQ